MKGIKITIIGAGSSYTPELIDGLIKRSSELPVREVFLLDIEESIDRLNIIYELTKRMFTKANLNITVNKGIDRRKALENSDFVITQIRVGLLEARIRDEEIALSRGCLGQETNGVVGLLKAIRTIPVILEICKDIHEICPNAWLINFTNPVGIVLEALQKYSVHRKFVGLCNVPINVQNGMSDLLKLPRDEVRIDFLGLNHMVYGFNVFHKNKNITKKALETYADHSQDLTMKNIDAPKWNKDFIKALNLIPCPYHFYYYKSETMLYDELKLYRETGESRGSQVKEIEKKLFEIYSNVELYDKPKELESRGGAFYSDAACSLINSIYNDKGDIQVVNTLSNGILKDFSKETVIETSCRISSNGPTPIEIVSELPISIKGLMTQIKTFEILVSEAAVEGDWNKVNLAISINPLSTNEDISINLIKNMIEASKEYLPNFF